MKNYENIIEDDYLKLFWLILKWLYFIEKKSKFIFLIRLNESKNVFIFLYIERDTATR